MIDPVFERRSIRRYKDDAVPKEMIEEIIKAGISAPSSKNRQPWKFIVTSGESKKAALCVMQNGIEREKRDPLLPESTKHLAAAEYTLRIMKQAPYVIFVVNPLGIRLKASLTPEERVYEICNAQSVGAAIENMILTATDLGLGSLWICDTYFAYNELSDWIGEEGELIAAVAIGYADEAPKPRPRKAVDDVCEWRE